jgi:hypothetical protein
MLEGQRRTLTKDRIRNTPKGIRTDRLVQPVKEQVSQSTRPPFRRKGCLFYWTPQRLKSLPVAAATLHSILSFHG